MTEQRSSLLCRHKWRFGIGLVNTPRAVWGCGETMAMDGPAVLVRVRKCGLCGHSVRAVA